MARLVAPILALVLTVCVIRTLLVSLTQFDSYVTLDWSESSKISQQTGRFPKYGTREFSQQCNWTRYRGNTGNCTFMVQPPWRSTEGIGNFIPQIVSGHLLALQMGCDLRLNYGDDVDIDQVLTHTTTDWNWTVPYNYDCESDPTCYLITLFAFMTEIIPTFAQRELAWLPYYRFTYNQNYSQTSFLPYTAGPLEAAIPGFDIDIGMACSIGSLFQLSPKANQFQPGLFSEILPSLNQEGTLVVAIYLRTGETDAAAKKEQDMMRGVRANVTQGESQSYRGERAQNLLDCAMQQESEYLDKRSYTRVVWLVVTDSPNLKQWITESYDNTRTQSTVPNSRQIPRRVVTTQSRGVHTKGQRGPSTADFAEALIDWYLIGESDLVVLDNGGPSFGGTAALRTARPVYDVTDGTCSKMEPNFLYFNEMNMRKRQCEHLQKIKGSKDLAPSCIYILNATGSLLTR